MSKDVSTINIDNIIRDYKLLAKQPYMGPKKAAALRLAIEREIKREDGKKCLQ